jgi:hypothetical protein
VTGPERRRNVAQNAAPRVVCRASPLESPLIRECAVPVRLPLVVGIIVLGTRIVVAQAPGPPAQRPPEPAFAAIKASERPTLDGRLEEPTWRGAAPIRQFTQVEPRDGAGASEQTEVWLAYDREAIYIAARLHDSQAGRIVSRLGRRDAETNSDGFVVAIDSYHDHRTSFRFGVNAAGVKSDAITSNDASGGDDSWDPVWDVATRIDGAGWTLEMRVPLSQLRFTAAETQTWGINFDRYILRTGELVRWAWAPNSETGYASHFGHLTGLDALSDARGHRLEVLPYEVTQGDFDTGADPDNPFFSGRRGKVTVGADFKFGVSSGLTLNGTINPDFGQVEADPAEVNLTVFETYFNERRPFFVEGANLFSFGAGSSGSVFGAPQLFYSRRIGRPPSAGLPRQALFTDAPEVTQIVGAAKLSGQVHGWSLGVLEAITAREEARLLMPGESARRPTVEPRTNYGVLSLRRDFRGGRTGIGAMATSVVRDIDTTSLYFLRNSAHAAGVDFYHRFLGDQYSISGTLSGSRLSGDPQSIISAQRSSARYYQRPDQHYVTFDPSRRALSGYSGSMSVGKDAGRWLITTDFFATSPGFEINDIGFQQSADRIFHGVRATHRWLRPSGLFRFAQASASGSQQWNYGGSRISAGMFGGFYGQLRNFWSASVNANVNPATLNDRVTRGGPMVIIPRQWNLNASVNSDSRRSVTGNVYGSVTRNRSGGYSDYGSLQVSVRPTSALSVSLAPSYNKTHSEAGYVTDIADPTATATYQRRYVVADLDQTSVDLTARAEMALTPALSLQLYAQPFTGAVHYETFKAFARASAFELMEYGRDGGSTITYDADQHVYAADADGPGSAPEALFLNPDFRRRTLRANLVLKWEYRAGSTLYLAWAHGRETFYDDPTVDVLSDFEGLFRDEQRNRVLLKVSYWFNP